MEDFPDELRTPPVSLIALVGCPELHAAIATHLNSEKPPINTLALPDFSKISVLAKPLPKHGPEASNTSSSNGILKRDWLLKHRTRVPSVVAAFFSSHHISGDPAQWLELSSQLDNLKGVIRARNTKMIVVVVQSTPNDDISEDRLIALKKLAEIDSKYTIFFTNEESHQKQNLKSLGGTFTELSNTYYKEEGRRIRTRIEKKSFSSIDLHVRYCFKVAVYAEFRRDWIEASRFYEDGYLTLREMIGTTKPPLVQRLMEIKMVAEQLHFKKSTLLLHGGNVKEAITWFNKHNASYKRIVGPPQAIFLHWEWMSRQFLTFAELLETISANVESISPKQLVSVDNLLTELEFYPAYYYQSAAHYLKEKASCLELALSLTTTINEIDGHAESVAPSVYVGQYARLLEQGEKIETQLLSEEEYINFALAEGKKFLDCFETIRLLEKSFESYNNLKLQRMASRCGFQLAREYFSAGDLSSARQHFDLVTSLYRQEGWVTMMWEVLSYLRECSRQQGLLKDFVEYSLEMAALPVSSSIHSQSFGSKAIHSNPANLSRREAIHDEVFRLIKGEIGLESNKNGGILKVTEDSPLHLEIDLVSPLRAALLASVAFHDQVVKPGTAAFVTLSLLTQLPHAVEIDELEVEFNQSNCNFVIRNARSLPSPPRVKISDDPEARRVENSPVLCLYNNRWLRLTYDIRPEQVGKLECLSIIARIGSRFTICCRAESPASMDGLPFWKFEDHVENFPTKDPSLAFSGQKALQVEEHDPLVSLTLHPTGPALVGEIFAVPVSVSSTGHALYSAELKINLVDSTGGGLFSPGSIEPETSNPHVELLGIGTDAGNVGRSFGIVPVPFLSDGESWSCDLRIKWHRPRSVMLCVSLTYSPCRDAQRVHAHRSLRIEGKPALSISHRFILPFRRDALLPDCLRIPHRFALPLRETVVLVVTVENRSDIAVELLSISIDDDGKDESALLSSGGRFKKMFGFTPEEDTPILRTGMVRVRWRRCGEVVTEYRLPDACVESPPLIASLGCPPYGVVGEAFVYYVIIENRTELLQEIGYSVADSQSFMLSGSHNDTVLILPRSDHTLGYGVVPLLSGALTLPRVTLTAARYRATFMPSEGASSVYVFPSERKFKTGEATTSSNSNSYFSKVASKGN